ncbi:hypothetical protein AC579_710 [Pseudocercospora musae]|uniref:F-box domain-containing protein n=1 Tax=Pseudocercospora musae TaxID=113226 RepID=A0A139GTQ7_9PEZI|nr:hypothetical protein AC579_710 [Pseudocercospora musae]
MKHKLLHSGPSFAASNLTSQRTLCQHRQQFDICASTQQAHSISPQQGHDYFTEMPLTLLQEIASHLPLLHKLKLRTVFKKQQEDVVVKCLGNGVRNLYVSPQLQQLDRFTTICKSPFFQQNVKQICFSHSEAEAQMSFAMYSIAVDEHRAESNAGLRLQSTSTNVLRAAIIKMTQFGAISVQFIMEEDGMNGCALHHGKKYHELAEESGATPSSANEWDLGQAGRKMVKGV